MRTLLAVAALALAACATKQLAPQDAKLKFDPDAHRRYFAGGNSEIRGKALLRESTQVGVTCAGTQVVATPATAFFRQVFALAANGQMPLVGEAVGPEYVSVIHIGTCDKEGNFSLIGLPPGDWLVAATVNWTVRQVTEGSLLVYKVRLKPKETIQIVMTDRDAGIPR